MGCVGWVGRRVFALLTRQMEWVTGGSGDEKADLRFMNKCKHSGEQLQRPVTSFGLGCGGGGGWGRWVERTATSLQVQSNENAQVTGAFNCIYGKSYGRRL